MIPTVNESDTNDSLLFATKHYADFRVWDGRCGEDSGGIENTRRSDHKLPGYCVVKAQRGARLMAIAPVCDCRCGRPLSQASSPRTCPFLRPPVKRRRRGQLCITFHKSHFFASKSHTYPPAPLIKARCLPSSHVARTKRQLGLKSRAIISKLQFRSMGAWLPPLP
jgi:hypothetical protein